MIAPRAGTPSFAPDGRRVALIKYGRRHRVFKHHRHVATILPADIYVMDVSTGAVQRMTHSPRQAESLSSWDPSGQRIAFIRFEGVRTRVFEVNADGSCQFALTNRPRHKTRRIGPLQFGLAWQPGPGRGAGPIAC